MTNNIYLDIDFSSIKDFSKMTSVIIAKLDVNNSDKKLTIINQFHSDTDLLKIQKIVRENFI